MKEFVYGRGNREIEMSDEELKEELKEERKWIARIGEKYRAMINVANNGKTPEENCKATGVCVHKFEHFLKDREKYNRVAAWLHVAFCVECSRSTCIFNPYFEMTERQKK